MELALSRADGTQWTRPFRSHLGYPKFLDVNQQPGMFDSGTMWTNAQFVDGPPGWCLVLGAWCLVSSAGVHATRQTVDGAWSLPWDDLLVGNLVVGEMWGPEGIPYPAQREPKLVSIVVPHCPTAH